MAGQPQEPSWTQQGQAYSQPPPGGAQQAYQQYPSQEPGTPGYGQAYNEQGQGQYPEPGQYEQPYGQPAPYEQPAQYEQPPGFEQPPGYEQTQVYEQQGYAQPGQAPGQGQYGEQPDHSQWQLPQASARPPRQRPAKAPKAPRPGGEKGFIGALFDFGFTSFVTPKIIKALYALATAWTILWALIFLRLGFKTGGTAGGLAVLIIADPILILLSLGIFRVVLEYFMINFRMQEDLRSLRERSESGAAANAGPTEGGQNET